MNNKILSFLFILMFFLPDSLRVEIIPFSLQFFIVSLFMFSLSFLENTAALKWLINFIFL